MATSTEEIVYGESTRAVTQQQNALDNLRSRTGILRAAATIVTSFLGGQALREDDGIGGVEWLGIGASSPSQR